MLENIEHGSGKRGLGVKPVQKFRSRKSLLEKMFEAFAAAIESSAVDGFRQPWSPLIKEASQVAGWGWRLGLFLKGFRFGWNRVIHGLLGMNDALVNLLDSRAVLLQPLLEGFSR